MKPWEGKHWEEIQNFIEENYKYPSGEVVLSTLALLKDALEKDWEEQQKEKEKSGHQELFNDEKKAESFTSSNWISVDERLPEKGQEYLVAIKCEPNFAYHLCTYSNNKFYTFEFTKEIRDVEYFMELPKLPRGA